ncbi:hypothetical protein [Streptomyces silvisoli]|uniref:Uncharacterized protein n=1 Tax=Streptomyces silvisoli TaxID=3034235 RepID=A0ABT5ZQ08_9ACTN|nr:hypothetical protein [Streptomyces silvisoli]MDF3291918.1 hypothetical protein [Streptomyces silvisoli]
MSTNIVPPADVTAERAQQILAAIEADPEFPAFRAATLEYSSDWQCFTGFPVIERWNLDADKEPLLTEGLRALAIKAAVYALTGDENVAEVPIAVPVDEMTHAMIAQPQLLARIAGRFGFQVIHQTDQEHTNYMPGCVTDQVYRLAWGEPPVRYWLAKDEVDRRLAFLADRYASIGLGRSGREHQLTFAV